MIFFLDMFYFLLDSSYLFSFDTDLINQIHLASFIFGARRFSDSNTNPFQGKVTAIKKYTGLESTNNLSTMVKNEKNCSGIYAIVNSIESRLSRLVALLIQIKDSFNIFLDPLNLLFNRLLLNMVLEHLKFIFRSIQKLLVKLYRVESNIILIYLLLNIIFLKLLGLYQVTSIQRILRLK